MGDGVISSGHRDTDNVMRHNIVVNCGRGSLRFRRDEPEIRAAHRNVVEENLFENAGSDKTPGIGVNVDARVSGIVVHRNRFVDTRGTMRCGIRLSEGVREIVYDGNTFEGITTPIRDERTTS